MNKVSHKVSRFVIWICSKFTREQIQHIIQELSDVLNNRNPDVKPKDDFKQKHPNYQNFFVDPKSPLNQPKQPPKLNYVHLLSDYFSKHGYHLQPVSLKKTLLH
jgi:hypothetical protein